MLFSVKKIKFYQLFLIVIIFVLLILFNSLHKSVSLQSELNSLDSDNGFIQLKDNYDGNKNNLSIFEFFNKSGSLEKMMNLYNTISNDKDIKYYEILTQPLEYIGEYKGEIKFTQGEELINQKIDNNCITPLNSIQISEKASEYLHLSNNILYGEYFSKDDYLLNDTQEVPVVLGNSYLGIYNLGDSFECYYLGTMKLKLKVIGFLKENSKFSLEYEYLLDNEIILPVLNINDTLLLKNKDFSNILYSLKNTGYIHYTNNDDYNYIINKIKNLVQVINIDWGYRGKVDNPFKEKPINISIETSNKLRIFAYLLTIILFILVYCLEKKYLSLLKFDSNKRKCLILKTKIFFKALITVLILYLILCFILLFLLQNTPLYFVIKNVQIELIPIILLCFIALTYVCNLNIKKSIKEC